MKLIQKIIFISGLIVATIFFLYTINFSSGWALGERLGKFYKEAQIVNKLIYKWALWTIIFGGLNILFHSHKNIKFYKLNYILITSFIICLLGSGIATIMNVPPLKTSYLGVNQADLDLITTINYSKIGTHVFNYGVYISILMFIQAGLILFITIYKTFSQIKRAKIKKLQRLEYSYEDSQY